MRVALSLAAAPAGARQVARHGPPAARAGGLSYFLALFFCIGQYFEVGRLPRVIPGCLSGGAGGILIVGYSVSHCLATGV